MIGSVSKMFIETLHKKMTNVIIYYFQFHISCNPWYIKVNFSLLLSIQTSTWCTQHFVRFATRLKSAGGLSSTTDYCPRIFGGQVHVRNILKVKSMSENLWRTSPCQRICEGEVQSRELFVKDGGCTGQRATIWLLNLGDIKLGCQISWVQR